MEHFILKGNENYRFLIFVGEATLTLFRISYYANESNSAAVFLATRFITLTQGHLRLPDHWLIHFRPS